MENLLHRQSEKPACAFKRDVLELAINNVITLFIASSNVKCMVSSIDIMKKLVILVNVWKKGDFENWRKQTNHVLSTKSVHNLQHFKQYAS